MDAKYQKQLKKNPLNSVRFGTDASYHTVDDIHPKRHRASNLKNTIYLLVELSWGGKLHNFHLSHRNLFH